MTEGAINSSLKYKQLILRLSEVAVRLKVCVSNGNVEKATKRRDTRNIFSFPYKIRLELLKCKTFLQNVSF